MDGEIYHIRQPIPAVDWTDQVWDTTVSLSRADDIGGPIACSGASSSPENNFVVVYNINQTLMAHWYLSGYWTTVDTLQ